MGESKDILIRREILDNPDSNTPKIEDMLGCPACRGKGTYPGLDITCRSCGGSGLQRKP